MTQPTHHRDGASAEQAAPDCGPFTVSGWRILYGDASLSDDSINRLLEIWEGPEPDAWRAAHKAEMAGHLRRAIALANAYFEEIAA